MASTIEVARVLQFQQNVIHLSQQRGSMLRGLFREEEVVGKRKAIERLASTSDRQKTTRLETKVHLDPTHTRRWLSTNVFYWSAMVDKKDSIQVIIDPRSEYAQSAAMAMARRYDQVLIDAFDASVVTGEDAGGTQTFDTSNQQIAAGGTDLTIGKLRQTKRIMDDAPLDPSLRRYFLCGPSQIESLLETTEVTSSDFNTVKALVMGEVNTFLGFTFIVSTLLDVAANVRDCYAFTQDAMIVGQGSEMLTDIDRDKTRVGHPWNVYMEWDLGAVRTQEDHIVKVLCDES